MKLGIIGGGQLGRMLAMSAHNLGIETLVLGQKGACAFQVSPSWEAEFDDIERVVAFANQCDAITFEFENIPAKTLAAVDAKKLAPNVHALEVSCDRVVEKTFLRELGWLTADFVAVQNEKDLREAVRTHPNAILKTCRFGYDGKGQAKIQHGKIGADALAVLALGPCIFEGFVSFSRELSLLGARGRDGKIVVWSLTENRNENSMLAESIAPAVIAIEGLLPLEVQFRVLLEKLDYVGVLALELFDCGDKILANEMAPRVHNSGHWTMDGAVTSQFENHVRAVCGLPLGDTSLLFPTRMQNLLGSHAPLAELCANGGFVHLYGKEQRKGRKLGHVNWRVEK